MEIFFKVISLILSESDTQNYRMGLHWVYEDCQYSDYVIKLDDDVIINIYEVVDFILKVMPLFDGPTFVCTEHYKQQNPERREDSKWYVTKEQFPHKYLPPFCKGRAYIMTTSLALRMSVLAAHIRFFWIDDVWAMGILGRLAGARHVTVAHPKTPQACFRDLPGDVSWDVKRKYAFNQWNALNAKLVNGIVPRSSLPCI